MVSLVAKANHVVKIIENPKIFFKKNDEYCVCAAIMCCMVGFSAMMSVYLHLSRCALLYARSAMNHVLCIQLCLYAKCSLHVQRVIIDLRPRPFPKKRNIEKPIKSSYFRTVSSYDL